MIHCRIQNRRLIYYLVIANALPPLDKPNRGNLLAELLLLLELGNTVQIKRRADEGQVAEGLRRVAQLLAAPRDLLRKHHQMVGEAEHVLKQVDGSHEILGLVD